MCSVWPTRCGILYGGRLLIHRKIEDLLTTTKRLRATLVDGRLPERLPANIIWQRVQGREWLVTVGEFRAEIVQELRAQDSVEHIEVVDLGLEDLFKDFVRGQRAGS